MFLDLAAPWSLDAPSLSNCFLDAIDLRMLARFNSLLNMDGAFQSPNYSKVRRENM